MYGQRKDGSFDFKQFFANFDLSSDVAEFWGTEFGPGKFLAELRMACYPPLILPKGTSGRFFCRRSGPSHVAMVAHQAQLNERKRAKDAMDKGFAKLDDVVKEMDAAHVPGVEQLKMDFAAAKVFIFDGMAHSNSRVLEFHLESIKDLAGTPSLPLGPHPGPVALPVMIPLAATLGEFSERWPSILTGATGLAFRIVATPLDLPAETMNYFGIIASTLLRNIKREQGSQCSTRQEHKYPRICTSN
jgi:hypothetical protein